MENKFHFNVVNETICCCWRSWCRGIWFDERWKSLWRIFIACGNYWTASVRRRSRIKYGEREMKSLDREFWFIAGLLAVVGSFHHFQAKHCDEVSNEANEANECNETAIINSLQFHFENSLFDWVSGSMALHLNFEYQYLRRNECYAQSLRFNQPQWLLTNRQNNNERITQLNVDIVYRQQIWIWMRKTNSISTDEIYNAKVFEYLSADLCAMIAHIIMNELLRESDEIMSFHCVQFRT